MNWSCTPNSCVGIIFRICILVVSLCACTDGGSPPPKETGYAMAQDWQRVTLASIQQSGLTVPYVVARQAANGQVHFAYYHSVAGQQPDTWDQQLNYALFNPSTGGVFTRVVENRPAPDGADGFDRCDQFDLALDNTTPVLIYPTYEINPALQQVEADIMVNLYEAGRWNEATGAVGFVERNPEYQDGHTKDNMSVAVDSRGDIHFCYQYFTEGMDSANYRYPDLYYARRDRGTLFVPITDINAYDDIEEQVDGNIFSSFGIHNSVGFHCKLLLDPVDELPVIIYAEHGEQFAGTFALKAAYRNAAGQWSRETIDTLPDGWTIGGISAAFYPPPIPGPQVPVDPGAPEPERPLAVAYALRSPAPEPDDAHRLMFAVKHQGSGWEIEIVDETTWCGSHCALAFTPEGEPAIAYLDEESHSGRYHHYLKYAEWNGILWVKETAEEHGNVGKYNSLWFDAGGIANIVTFSDADNEIWLIRQTTTR
jgi:hypothetical protein